MDQTLYNIDHNNLLYLVDKSMCRIGDALEKSRKYMVDMEESLFDMYVLRSAKSLLCSGCMDEDDECNISNLVNKDKGNELLL